MNQKLGWFMLFCTTSYAILGVILTQKYRSTELESLTKDILMVGGYLLGLLQGYWVARTLKREPTK